MAERYAKSAFRAEIPCPVVAILLPGNTDSSGRPVLERSMFTDLLQALNEVKTGYHKSSGGRAQTIASRVKVVYMKISNLSHGIRPSTEVPPDAFRARIGRDTAISDLIKTLRRGHNSISFDFGGTSWSAEFAAFINTRTRTCSYTCMPLRWMEARCSARALLALALVVQQPLLSLPFPARIENRIK